MNTSILEEIGLTKSEIKVYLALLETGPTTKSPLVKKSKISSSKIYEVTDKLIDKGLVSYFLKNKVKYFKAAPVSRIKHYLIEKQTKLKTQEKDLNALLPKLEANISQTLKSTQVELFEGWSGLETVFQEFINILKKGDIDYVIGASQGHHPEKTRQFFDKYTEKAARKGLKVKVIFNESSRKYFKSSQAKKHHIESRYIEQTTPSEINIYKENVAIIIWTEKPIIIIIRSKEAAHSFKQYFEVMWKIARK